MSVEAPEQEEVAPARYTVAVDCDGVLHSYLSGWQGAESLPDPPVDGAIEWLNEVGMEYDLVIHTTRASHAGGAVAVGRWLRDHGCVVPFVVTAEKRPALVYIDDRAYRFRGRFPTVRQIRYALKPWRADDPPRTYDTEKARRKNQYYIRLEASNSRLRRQRLELLHELLGEILRAAGLEGDVADEWRRQHSQEPWEKRLEAARQLRDDWEER